MFPFRRKKEEDAKIPGHSEDVKIRRRRKKEVPPKPWGKIERIVVFALLVALTLASAIVYLNSKKSKTAQKAPIEALPIISQINVAPKDTKELKDSLSQEIENLKGEYGIWVQALDNSYNVGINEDDQFEGASFFKLPMMIAYYEEVDKGAINPNSTYSLKFSDAQAGAGNLANLPEGTVITYHDIVEAMGKNSDNTAFQIMGTILGFDKETKVINELSMENTDFSNSLTTPKDMGTLFYKLINTNIISDSSKFELLSFLKKTDFESLIPQGIDDNIEVAHKYGSAGSSLNDAGIVYVNKPYIIAILSKDVNFDEANIEIPKISKIVYDWAR